MGSSEGRHYHGRLAEETERQEDAKMENEEPSKCTGLPHILWATDVTFQLIRPSDLEAARL